MAEYMSKIPFNRPFIAGKELYYIAQAVTRGHLAGDGYFSKRCAEWLQASFSARRVLLTHSCTAALEMSALLCDISEGDEVILPSFTFVSTATAFVLRGARPVFVDIREDTLNIDEALLKGSITDRTRAIVPVHYAGVGCEMDAILDIAAGSDIPVIEDAAQGVNATYRGRYLGTLGSMGCYSFHETKNFISGEGGALVLNDERFFERAEIIREKGTNRSKFFRGEIDKYTWVDIGSSYLPSELVAAFLYAQLEESETITRKRLSIYEHYARGLAPLEQDGLVRLPVIPHECSANGHMFYLLLPDGDTRNALMDHLVSRKIHAVFHYIPLHTSPMGQKFGYKNGDLPATESLSERLLRLPCYYELEEHEQDRVIEEITRFLKGSH